MKRTRFYFFHYSKLGGSIANGIGGFVKAKKTDATSPFGSPRHDTVRYFGRRFRTDRQDSGGMDGLFCLNHCGRSQATSKVDLDKSI